MIKHPNRSRRATIATNDPAHDPMPRVLLTRERRDGRYVWLNPDSEMVADGATAEQANATLMGVYNWVGWGLRFRRWPLNPEESRTKKSAFSANNV